MGAQHTLSGALRSENQLRVRQVVLQRCSFAALSGKWFKRLLTLLLQENMVL